MILYLFYDRDDRHAPPTKKKKDDEDDEEDLNDANYDEVSVSYDDDPFNNFIFYCTYYLVINRLFYNVVLSTWLF